MGRKRKAEQLCPTCDGKGRVTASGGKVKGNKETRARQGGNARLLRSRASGQLSMAEMGRKGGRPRAPILADLDAREGRPKEEAP